MPPGGGAHTVYNHLAANVTLAQPDKQVQLSVTQCRLPAGTRATQRPGQAPHNRHTRGPAPNSTAPLQGNADAQSTPPLPALHNEGLRVQAHLQTHAATPSHPVSSPAHHALLQQSATLCIPYTLAPACDAQPMPASNSSQVAGQGLLMRTCGSHKPRPAALAMAALCRTPHATRRHAIRQAKPAWVALRARSHPDKLSAVTTRLRANTSII